MAQQSSSGGAGIMAILIFVVLAGIKWCSPEEATKRAQERAMKEARAVSAKLASEEDSRQLSNRKSERAQLLAPLLKAFLGTISGVATRSEGTSAPIVAVCGVVNDGRYEGPFVATGQGLFLMNWKGLYGGLSIDSSLNIVALEAKEIAKKWGSECSSFMGRGSNKYPCEYYRAEDKYAWCSKK